MPQQKEFEPMVRDLSFRAPKGQFLVVSSNESVSADEAAMWGREATVATRFSLEEAKAVADARAKKELSMFVYDDQGRQVYAKVEK